MRLSTLFMLTYLLIAYIVDIDDGRYIYTRFWSILMIYLYYLLYDICNGLAPRLLIWKGVGCYAYIFNLNFILNK